MTAARQLMGSAGALRAQGNPIDDPPSLDDSLDDVGDGKSDVKGLLAAFEQDIAVAVGTCTGLG